MSRAIHAFAVIALYACTLLFAASCVMGGVLIEGVFWLVGVFVFGVLALTTSGGAK